ncbi:MAG: hypothetical protein NTY53_13895 [Kiritimatiellaeota bacterium]|nr:hypothetical protein [Kiritimatiellota bacterium]
MRSVWAIALISLRNAVRSRVVVLLLTILVLGVIGIPLTVKSDGTLAGYVQILVRYTLGFSMGVLMLATVWAGCAAVASEIQRKQIHLLVTKPVSAAQLWLGKWLGLVILNTVVLAVCGLVTYGLLRWNTRAEILNAADREQLATEIIVARARLAPQPFAVEERVQKRFTELQGRNELPTNMPPAAIYKALFDIAQIEAHTVKPGGKINWRFELPPGFEAAAAFQLRCKLASALLAPMSMRGRWVIQRERGGELCEVNDEHPSHGQHSLSVPGKALIGEGAVLVEYDNVNETPVTLLFDPQTGLRMLVPVGGWLANFLRALLISDCLLALIAALGITAGSMFSMPVAAFVVFQTLIIFNTAGMIHSLATREASFAAALPGMVKAPGWLDAAMSWFYRGLELVIMPMQNDDPLAMVATGEWISWPVVAWTFTKQIVLTSGLLLLLAAAALRRRELALPTD